MKPEALGAHYESILDKDVRKEGGVYYKRWTAKTGQGNTL